MKQIKRIINILIILLTASFSTSPVSAVESAPKIVGESAIVIDVETGDVLYEKNPDIKHYPASITKCMTALVVLENRDLDDTVEYSNEALLSIESGSSAAYIKPGEIMTVEESLYVMMLHSANDVAHGLAYEVGGDLPGFAQMMNKKAKELGCTDTNFVNASGLNDSNHYTTASDMAKIAQAAYCNEILQKIMGTVRYEQPATNLTKNTRTWINGNRMIREGSEYYYEPCLGGKTGYTVAAGGTLITYARLHDRVLACVILKSQNSAKAYEDSIKLYKYIDENKDFSVYQQRSVEQKNKESVEENTQTQKTIMKETGNILKIAIEKIKDDWILIVFIVLLFLYVKRRIHLKRKAIAREKARQRAKAKARQRERERRRRYY
ncbi:MAG: D-alanyl-D-alanine carboxypeptidase family protein [Anaerostipes faecalis]|uniref:D-alanyl-D-alanine carboxypeptidase family protein n=1 Tax=Anaerostipes faecalis TaxID=2738446 RepID=UPI001C1DE6A1|nr:D-alanyl-D-alanine carboxypeptidase family protein [Anaerostipes faecalis]MDY2726071.1 D-alanyl-D-alanine carboxypeptidase family protein [Anaerostipes faecalis]